MDGNLPEPRDRLDQPIFSAIDSKNLKQALKLVDKRLGKKPTDEFLQALRCYIQSQHPSLNERQAAVIAFQGLIEKQVAFADLDVLALYDEAAVALFLSKSRESNENLGKLRLFAVKARPKDEKLCKNCLKACLGRDDLAISQQIAVIMETSFPENRNYPFWSIAIMSLFAKSSSCPMEQRKMYSRLAYGKIKKIASVTTETTNGAAAPLRSIQTPQELKLLHDIVKREAGTREYLELLKTPALGPYSKAAKGEWGFIRAKMAALEELQLWQELFDDCDALLAKAHANNDTGTAEDTRGGDWSVWTAYILAAKMLNAQEPSSRVLQMLTMHTSPEAKLDKTYRRNAHLAMLSFSFGNPPVSERVTISDGESVKIENVPTLVYALFSYLHFYAENPSAYNDVSAFIESLTPVDRVIFLDVSKEMHTPKALIVYSSEEKDGVPHSTLYAKRQYSTINRITARLTMAKIAYLIKICIPESARLRLSQQSSSKELTCDCCGKSCEIACKTCLAEMLAELLPLYQDAIEDQTLVGLLPTDSHPADDFYILGATCLLKMAGFRPPIDSDVVDINEGIDISYVIQATALLEYALSRSKVNSEMMLLLVRLYSFIGAGSLAIRVYKRLRIKQVQFDTLGYTMFDRISSLHPYPSTQFKEELSELRDASFLLEHQKFYKKMHGQVTRNSWISLDNGSYNTIFGLAEVSDHLSRSTARVMSVLELRRVNRITHKEMPLKQSSYGYDILPGQPELVTEWHDNSDYLSFPNFEPVSAQRFEKYTRLGPAPSSLRTRAFLMIEKLLILTNTTSEGLTTKASIQSEIESSVQAIQQLESELLGKKVFTNSERTMVQIHFDVFKLLQTMIVSSTNGKASSDTENKSKLETTILQSLTEQTKIIAEIESVLPPLFTTILHPLYISHELETNILTISSSFKTEFLANSKNKVSFNQEIIEAATNLKQAVVEKVTALKKKILEGGLLNGVIDEVAGLDASTVAWDEAWLEQWAGELVGSWEDAVDGLVGCVKG